MRLGLPQPCSGETAEDAQESERNSLTVPCAWMREASSLKGWMGCVSEGSAGTRKGVHPFYGEREPHTCTAAVSAGREMDAVPADSG